jgi:hypothetical protein
MRAKTIFAASWGSQYSVYKPVFLNRHTEANHNMGSMDRGIRYVMLRATTAWPAIRATTIVNAPTGSMDRAGSMERVGNLDWGTDGDSFSKRLIPSASHTLPQVRHAWLSKTSSCLTGGRNIHNARAQGPAR